MSANSLATADITPAIVTAACQITDIRSVSANTYLVDFIAPENVALDYIAGHYLKLDLDVNNDGQFLSLFYSIANAPDPQHPRRLQILIQKTSAFVENVLNTLSDHARSNKSVNITLPMGHSFLQTDLSLPHVLIAAGSGIAKIKCLADTIAKQNPNADVKIYWSNKSIDDFYFLDELKAISARCPNITFTPILELAEENWTGRSGFIYEVIQEDFQSLADAKLYVCGSPQMVYGTIDQLQSNGVRIENCYSDAFEHAPREQ